MRNPRTPAPEWSVKLPLGGDSPDESAYPGAARRLSGWAIQQGFHLAGPLCVAAHFQVGTPNPSEGAEKVDHVPLLASVQQAQERSSGCSATPDGPLDHRRGNIACLVVTA